MKAVSVNRFVFSAGTATFDPVTTLWRSRYLVDFEVGRSFRDPQSPRWQWGAGWDRLYWMWGNGCDYSPSFEFGSYVGQPGSRHGVQ